MIPEVSQEDGPRPRWRYLLLAVLIFIVAAALMAGLWQLPQAFPRWFEASPSATPPPASPSATPAPAILEPTITGMVADANDLQGTITFQVSAAVPADRQISQLLLWYDTQAGHQLVRIPGPLSGRTTVQRRLDAAREGLTRTLTTSVELDYWWLVQDTAGDQVRAGGVAILGPNLRSLVTPPAPEPALVDFTWGLSETGHFELYYVPDRAAERDRFEIGALAEDSLDRMGSTLAMDFDEQMSIYLVPRVFWQGGAAYGDKIQLISYLDRNYTGIETWSYFTHEGTHALAQDLLLPKENGGGPDGVLVEGLAVWASRGHYRIEPLDAWAAVVASSDEYLPLADLREGPFYDFQHETAYVEAGSFTRFLVERYGLDKLKELYGLATGDEMHDDALVRELYGQGYAELEAAWLDYLAGLQPTREQAETWTLKVRSFDLMRRYQTELDPDARTLPGSPPPEWTSDTLKIFTRRLQAPANVVLETALTAAQQRIYSGDLRGAAALLDDVEVALDLGGRFTRPSLTARQDVVDLVAAQDRAVLRADARAYQETLAPGSTLAREAAVDAALYPAFVAYRQELVGLDLADDGNSAEGLVLLHAEVVGGSYEGDGQLRAVGFVRTPRGWRMASRQEAEVALALPSVRGD
ncbi:MAG: hypothetical protein M8467_13135 [Anaerolineae bacterium]|nr:hypothetical protein [Anaerolineae bacterium]